MDVDGLRILTLSKDPEFKKKVKKVLPQKNITVYWESKLKRLFKRFDLDSYEVVILTSEVCHDGKLDITDVLQMVASKSPNTQILLLVDPKDLQVARKALQAGTYQYTKLPVSEEELQLLIESALEKRPQVPTADWETGKGSQERLGPLVGRSLPMQQAYMQIRQAAAADIPILLLGETGTGKDLAAQIIHQQSGRREETFIPVNLGSLPSDLVASELFGHEKGAFTGAVNQQKGVFERASRGTVFLDEIDTIDEKVQVSLLRLIEQKKIHRLGGRHSFKSEARIIAASNENLEKLVQQGAFRKDLYYRLDVFRITMAPLRHRREDIPLLVEEMLAYFNQSFGKNILGVATECLEILQAYNWPGNIRELKNVIQRAVLICENDIILPEHLPSRFRAAKPLRSTVTFEIGTSLDEVERQMIIRVLAMAKNNRSRAAEMLGISRRAIYNKLKKHNIC